MTANNITDGKVQTLPIKPLKTHAGEAGRRSSITSFDDMLKAQGTCLMLAICQNRKCSIHGITDYKFHVPHQILACLMI